MSIPTVCCVMLTRDREQMTRRAVRSYLSQTYENKVLLAVLPADGYTVHEAVCLGAPAGATIGALRNWAMQHQVAKEADVVVHWDSDDVSSPQRLTEQVALLQASGAECVGYNSMLFWDTHEAGKLFHPNPCERAWLYRNPNSRYALGTSMCYWRSAWERVPFDDIKHGEDQRWQLKVKGVVGVSAQNAPLSFIWENGVFKSVVSEPAMEPRMVAAIHGANTSTYAPEKDKNMWRRVSEWDEHCRKVMQL